MKELKAASEVRLAPANPAADAAARVLLVEDDRNYGNLIERTLTRSKEGIFEVSREERLRVALRRIEEDEFDGVLLDLSLPDGRGLFTLGSARSLVSKLPVLVLTGSDDDRLVRAAARIGACEYLLKHRLNPRVLPQMVLRAIHSYRKVRRVRAISDGERLLALSLRRAIGRAEVPGPGVAVLVLRYDDFEALRFCFGSGFCADLQGETEEVLRGLLGPGRAITALAPGVFGAVLEDVRSDADASRPCTELLSALGSADVDGSDLGVPEIKASIGIAMFPWDGVDAEALIASAREAQRLASRSETSCYRFRRQGEALH